MTAPQIIPAPDDPAVWLPTRIRDAFCPTCQVLTLVRDGHRRCLFCDTHVDDPA